MATATVPVTNFFACLPVDEVEIEPDVQPDVQPAERVPYEEWTTTKMTWGDLQAMFDAESSEEDDSERDEKPFVPPRVAAFKDNRRVVCGRDKSHGLFEVENRVLFRKALLWIAQNDSMFFDNSGRNCPMCVAEFISSRSEVHRAKPTALCGGCRSVRGSSKATVIPIPKGSEQRAEQYVERTGKRFFVYDSKHFCAECKNW